VRPLRIPWVAADVREIVVETPRVKTIRLAVPGWPGHVPGQHVDVRLTAEDGYQAQRSYSIASPPEEDGIALTIERLEDGEVSTFCTDELRAGDRLELRGPLGGYFTWTVDLGGPLALVAGGSGIVPLMAMIRHRAAVRSDVPMRLLYSAKKHEDVIYRDELEGLAGRGDGLEAFFTFTRGQPEGWTGYSRRVDRELLAEVGWPAAESPLAYACGPTGFVEAVASALVEMGLQPASVKTERFGPTGG
jgi:ferredoxin-NADP reductase